MDYFRSFGITLGQGKFYEESIYGIVLLYNLLNNAMISCLKEFDLTPAKFNVLMTIRHQGETEGISQVEISKHLIVTPSNMTRLLDKLEREKLVHRFDRKNDRRVNVVRITERGSSLLDRVWPGYNRMLKKVGSQLNLADQRKLSQLVIKWIRVNVD
ncbi:MAG: MarR family transcriptional regulator [Candidatus Omnitrophica bacterium]|nr:MarR family transcriptional regulator [Candidatus Omnitrophota bacterium]